MYTKGLHNTPSAAHLAKLIGSSPEVTAKNILTFQQKDIYFNLNRARESLIKLLSGMEYKVLVSQTDLIKDEKVRNATVEILALGQEFIETFQPSWFKPVDKVFYSISKELKVPLKPIGLIAVDGRISVVSAPLWKTIGLNVEQFRIWASLMNNGFIEPNPDIDDFLWLEMSAPKTGFARELSVRDMETVDLLTELEFAGLRMNIQAAIQIVSSVPKEKKDRKIDPRQGKFDY